MAQRRVFQPVPGCDAVLDVAVLHGNGRLLYQLDTAGMGHPFAERPGSGTVSVELATISLLDRAYDVDIERSKGQGATNDRSEGAPAPDVMNP